MALRGFDALGASAALHSATADSFIVSGTFRDSADFAVLMLWDSDNFYEHPRLRYLPDFDFTGAVLTFDVVFSPGVQPIDSPKSNWIDWATFDYITYSDDPKIPPVASNLRLWDNCRLKSGDFTAASGTFHLETTAAGIQPTDRLTIFFQNFYFDYRPSANATFIDYAFYASGTGTAHSITVNGHVYTHTEIDPAGESSPTQANSLVTLINAGSGDPDVTASIVPDSAYSVRVTVRPSRSAAVSSTDYGVTSLGLTTLNDVATALAQQINTTDWWGGTQPVHALRATVNGNALTVNAARYGYVSTLGTKVTLTPGSTPFVGLATGGTISINAVPYTIASVDSPTTLTLTTSAGDQTKVHYVADRGGVDGNMIELYALSASPALKTTEPFVRLSGGNSQVTWTCTIDFSFQKITAIRQCWFTYAAALSNSAAFTDTEWSVTYTNWRLSGPDSVTQLWVAGPGSARVEEHSSACTYTGAWATPSPESGFFSGGLARRAGVTAKEAKEVSNETLTVKYNCASVHDLYIGSSLYSNSATLWISLDGGSEFAFSSLLLNTGTQPAVNARRRILPSVPAGSHTVKFRLKDFGYFYFDFLEAAVVTDVPPPPEARPNLSPALDYSTDHSWKLPPARILWILDNLGFTGPVNQYIGIFWWNQRTNAAASFSSATITFAAPPTPGATLKLTLAETTINKIIFPGDTLETIAGHFARYINSVFVGVWASFSGPVLTITVRSPAYSFDPVNLPGATVKGDLKTSEPGLWTVDPSQSPALNRGARDWHSDLYRECKLRNREVTTAGSMELVFPPDNFAARYPDGSPVVTSNLFDKLRSLHCAQSSPMRNYQQSVFDCVADLQNAAGLIPNFQLGEYLWWFFPGPGGMAFYDPETKAAAQAALGRPLYTFLNPNDDNPAVNASADALFLRARLRDHVSQIIAHVRSRYPNAVAEVLFAYDVNYPTPNSDQYGPLGGALNRFINFPAEWGSHTTAGFDRLKVEALAFGSRFHNLNLAKAAIEFPLSQDWPLAQIRYLAPIFTHSSAWQKEVAMALSRSIPIVNLWAFDQMNIFGLKIGKYHNQSRSLKMG